MTKTTIIDCQVISSDYPWGEKIKRFRRSLLPKAENFFRAARGKMGEIVQAIATFLKDCNRYAAKAYETVNDIKKDWNMEKNFLQKTADFLFGPTPTEQLAETESCPIDFSTGNIANQMAGTVVAQRGFISEEQVGQFQQIAQNAKENTKRVKSAVKAIGTVSSSETETSRLVYQILSKLESDSFKRSEYQAKRRQQHQLMQEKFNSLRKGL